MISSPIHAAARRPVAGVLLLLIIAAAADVAAGPLYDPFVEKFQVGTWSKPGDVSLTEGYPAGLLEPARLDTTWTRAAMEVLSGRKSASTGNLTHRFLSRLHPDGQDELWLATAQAALNDLSAGRAGRPDVSFLLRERLAMAFGRAVETGDYDIAVPLAVAILGMADTLGLDPRESLIWDLRLRLSRQLAGDPQPQPDELWPALGELAPFDTGSAWVLWVACRQGAGLPILPQTGDPEELGKVLGRLGQGWFKAEALYNSCLDADWQSGIGAILLASKELPAHFKKFPQPPSEFTRQGWWLRGQRRLRNGQAGAYENLAVRPELKPGWRMDIWRRASELRLLKGAWVEGLDDLEKALNLAQQGRGTKGLRRRLRQWTEQALVLALAHDDPATARRIRDLGLRHFQGKERETFAAEIRHWAEHLDAKGSHTGPASADRVDQARYRVVSGAAAEVLPVSEGQRAGFLAAADNQLWETWYKWGLTLANPLRVTGERRKRAFAYREALFAGLEADSDQALADSALAVIALRFRDRPWVDELLHKALDVEAGRLCGWQTPPLPSPVPDLLPEVRGSELDRHALLGFCLATGDMRGILGLAFELPGRGLTRDEKRLFLYPLPASGPVREAIRQAGNEAPLLLAVARNESLFEPAVRSRAGALGWMQIMPFHYPAKGALFGPGNWRIPAASVQRGDGLLTENRRRYKGDPYRILAAYNAGPGAASRWDRQLGGGAPNDIYLAWIGYPETRAYVEKVLIDREIYRGMMDAKSTETSAGTSGPEPGKSKE